MFVVRLLTSRYSKVLWKHCAFWSNCLVYLSSIFFRVLHIFRESIVVVDVLS